MNETLFDQIPALAGLQRTLEELAMMNVPTHTNTNIFLIQQLPEYRSKILAKYSKSWKELADGQKTELFDEKTLKVGEEVKDFEDVYNYHMLDEFLEKPVCGSCGKPATQRCSKCRSEWYCGRECQIKGWKTHKEICEVLSKAPKPEKKAQEKKISHIQEVD